LLQSSADTYRVLGVISLILACLSIAGGILLAVLRQEFVALPFAIIFGIVMTGTAVVLFNRATMIRLQAELALATRDIARNSFR
jgi:hypothetical protein